MKVAVARKADALIEVGAEKGERLRLHRVPLEGFSTVYSLYAALAGYEGPKWERLASKVDEDEVLSLRDSDGLTVLHWAAQDESRAKLAGVIAARHAGLVNVKDQCENTPLHYAAMHVMQVLLAAGADTRAKNGVGRTALHLAVMLGRYDMVPALLAGGADKKALDNNGRTPYAYAAMGGG